VLPDGNVYGVDMGLWRSIPNGHSPTTRTLLNIPGRYGVVWIPFTACVCTSVDGIRDAKSKSAGRRTCDKYDHDVSRAVFFVGAGAGGSLVRLYGSLSERIRVGWLRGGCGNQLGQPARLT
jgi:hypothetical protein